MAIFAHPDDESTVAPILTKYAEEGVKVHLVIVTDGRLGTNEYSDYEAGDALAAVRRKEMQCAADILGVELMHLDYEDQLKSAEGYDGHIPHVRALIKEVDDIVDEVDPDALITFGPDGWTNHMDHRLVGATVTQVYLHKLREKPMNLYYVGTPTDKIDDPQFKILKGQDRSYLTTQVSYSKENRDTAFKALACHKSQFPIESLEKMQKQRAKEEKIIYLRKFAKPSTATNSVFE
jgi:LmbE family N-acetylglucosaminyl deacetylase